MRQFLTAATVVILFCCGTSAMAFNWNYYNFGSTPFDANNNTSPIGYPSGVGHRPSPGLLGEGGEKFDLEGLFIASDNDYLYVALTNSFGLSSTSTAWGSTFNMGDVFFGFGGNNNRFAIDVSTGKLMQVTTWNFISNKPGSYYGNTSIRARVGAFEVGQGSELGTANQIMTSCDNLEHNHLTPGNGNTYVFEWRFNRSLVSSWDGASELFFHATLGCGNDLVEKPYMAIPEPGTMILLGLGLFGAGLIARRK